MKDNRDPWYVRLPDGRTFKAKSTAAVKHHIESGQIPLNSHVRRTSEEEWQALAWVQEFANQNLAGTNRSPASIAEVALPPETPKTKLEAPFHAAEADRNDSLKLQTVGIRGYVDELFAAFDSSLNQGKLIIGCIAGGSIALGSFLLLYLTSRLELPSLIGNLLVVVWALGSFVVSALLIGKQTQQELSRLAPVSWKVALRGLVPTLIQSAIAVGIIGGICYGVLYLFQFLERQVSDSPTMLMFVDTIGTPSISIVFLIALLTPLILPIFVVEDASFRGAIREWCKFLGEHRLRVLLYQAFAILMGLIATFPLILPVYLAQNMGVSPQPSVISLGMRCLLVGVAFGPFLTYLIVSNLFIYLNLKYEYSPNR